MDPSRFTTKSFSGPPKPQTTALLPATSKSVVQQQQHGAISNDLERELTCSICTSIFHHPVTLLDCLHSYCGACAKEWFAPAPAGNTAPSAYPVSKGCPTCRQSVRAIKPSSHLASLAEIFLKHNPDHARDKDEIDRLAASYKPGDRIIVDTRSSTGTPSRQHNLQNRRAGDGWWDGLLDEDEDDQFYAAISASMRDLIPRANSLANTLNSLNNSSPISTTGAAAGRLGLFAPVVNPQIQINCDSCHERYIQSDVHYHCNQCQNNNYDICQDCFMRGVRCLAPQSSGHQLISRRFNSDSNDWEQGIFCDTEACRKNCNDVFWSCSICQTPRGTFKYCPDCVNSGTCCSHDLITFSSNSLVLESLGLDRSIRNVPAGRRPTGLVEPKPIKVITRCDLCSQEITPATQYYHCRMCHNADWDCHTSCLLMYNPMTANGGPKCMMHHPLQTLIQVPMPNHRNPTHIVRRALSSP